jgi:hypothetical protein
MSHDTLCRPVKRVDVWSKLGLRNERCRLTRKINTGEGPEDRPLREDREVGHSPRILQYLPSQCSDEEAHQDV